MGLKKFCRHDCGVLLTEDVVGKVLWSHSDACQGRMVKLFITEVGYTHTWYEKEDGKRGCLATGNRGKGARNWEVVDFDTAQETVLHYFEQLINKKEEELRALKEGKEAIVSLRGE